MSRAALAPGRSREFEIVYILRPNTEKDSANDLSSRIATAIKDNDGVVTSAELWGQRRLAYPIKKHHRGIYIFLKFLGRGETVREIERQLRLADSVLRFQTIVTGDDIAIADTKIDDAEAKFEFEVPFEADEPELTRERELGLDTPAPERRQRRDREWRDKDGDDNSDATPAAAADKKEGAAADKKEGAAADKKEGAAAAPAAKPADAPAAAPEAAPEKKEGA